MCSSDLDGRQESNRYPSGAFARVESSPSRGDRSVTVDEAGQISSGDEVFVLCDDYGDRIEYAPRNWRSRHYLLKQHLQVRSVDGNQIELDGALRHDFAGASPRVYRWQPLRGFGIEHLSFEDKNSIPDSEASNTFRTVRIDGSIDSWVWNVHFLNSTSIPLSIQRSRFATVSECLFRRAQHLGGGGNGYLPELYQTDDSLVEY